MSVWPESTPSVLSTEEGDLLLASIDVEPRQLESLLETLAQLDFPVNPQIYHDASVVYQYRDGREVSKSATLVEFPAYEVRLEEVRRALAAAGFDSACVHAINMLDEIHSGRVAEPAPQGSPYVARYRVKCRAATPSR
ncbi:MAG TPA: hypothetical protein VKB88_07945 [Bryobacteraceae bacterium]|nr:hypothetical protein [Bryobacteraceae bacterium]